MPFESTACASRSQAVWAVLAIALALILWPGLALAEPNDDAGEALVEQALKPDDFAAPAKAPKTLAKLELAKKLCDNKGCSATVRSKVFVAIGTVKALTKKEAEAKDAFAAALKENPNATLLPNRSPPEVKKLFDEAKAPAAAPTAAPGGAKCKEEGRPPQGWKSSAAFCFFAEAVAAESAQDWSECIANADASQRAEDRPTTRYLGASCREKAGRWTEALRDYQGVVEPATRAGMAATAQEAQKRAKALRERMPVVILRPPEGVKGLKVTIDDAPVPAERLSGEIWVDPGSRKIAATGELDGKPYRFQQAITIGESQKKTIEMTRGAAAAVGGGTRDPSVEQCIAQAKTREDAVACLPENRRASALTFKVGGEFSYYKDTDAVNVATPAVFASIENPTGGWGLGASFLVDVVTAASVDITSTASPSWTEIRYVPGLRGHKKFGDTDLSAKTSLSVEPDYLAIAVGAGLAVDLAQKMVTPNIGYDFGYELSGRAGTPFSVFSHKIQVHALTLGSTFVLDKATIVVPTLTGIMLLGDTSKPYRFLPMFTPEDTVNAGETIRSVNLRRLPFRVDEQVPDDRKRLAFALLFARRFTSATLRLEERIYIDDWGLKATTSDLTFPIDFTTWLRVWPHLRFHAQTAVDFWELAYRAERTSGGYKIPQLRTGDRELGPLLAGTAGLGTRFDIGGGEWGLTLTGDAIYTRFLDHLYVRGRLGVFAAASLETKFE